MAWAHVWRRRLRFYNETINCRGYKIQMYGAYSCVNFIWWIYTDAIAVVDSKQSWRSIQPCTERPEGFGRNFNQFDVSLYVELLSTLDVLLYLQWKNFSVTIERHLCVWVFVNWQFYIFNGGCILICWSDFDSRENVEQWSKYSFMIVTKRDNHGDWTIFSITFFARVVLCWINS